MEEAVQPEAPRCSRASSSCSTAVPPGPGGGSSGAQDDSRSSKASAPRSRSASGSSDQDADLVDGERSTRCSKPSEWDAGSASECAELVPLKPQAACLLQARSDLARRGGCGMGCVMDWVCRRLFRSDLVEYDFGSLEKVADLGEGTFGRVCLVWCSQTNQCLALKDLLVKRRLQSATRSEKMIMRRIDSPFLTKLVATFNRDQHLYMLMEAARGGDLHEVYMRKDFWGAEEHARFYAACVVSGLEYLHDRRIIYRDLKMENVVLDQRGYAKICDFGMSRFLWPSIGTAYTICGTPEYQAPEINAGTGYDHAVDWWALGILLYELMMGATPFLAESAAGVHKNVSAGIDKVIPQAQRGSWSSLVCSLCQQEPGKRLPLLSGGVENVRRHPWFQESALEWSKLHSGHLVAPYVPQLDGAKAIGHFNVKEEVCPPQDPPQCAADTAWDEDYEDPVGPYVCEAGCHHQA